MRLAFPSLLAALVLVASNASALCPSSSACGGALACMAPVEGYVLGTEICDLESSTDSPRIAYASLVACANASCGCSGDSCSSPCGAIQNPEETDFDLLASWGGALPSECLDCLATSCGAEWGSCAASGCE